MIRLAELAANPGVLGQVATEEIAGLLTELAALQTSLAIRLLNDSADRAQDAAAEDRLLDIEEAAGKLGVSKDWLYRRSDKLPFTVRIGRALRFSGRGIEKYIRARSGR